MIRGKNGVYRRPTPRMSKLHPWMVCFDLAMSQEVFNLLYKEIINRTSYGLDVLENPGLATITFTNLRKVCALFSKFEDCEGFVNELGARKGVEKVIVDDSMKGIMRQNFQQEIFKLDFFYGDWNASSSIEIRRVCLSRTCTVSKCNQVERRTSYILVYLE